MGLGRIVTRYAMKPIDIPKAGMISDPIDDESGAAQSRELERS